MQVFIDFLLTTDGSITKQFKGSGKWQNNAISFVDEATDTFEIFYDPKEVTLKRSGFHPLMMKYTLKTPSTGNLMVDHALIKLKIFTEHLFVGPRQLVIQYHLLEGESIYSRHHIEMHWELKTEGI